MLNSCGYLLFTKVCRVAIRGKISLQLVLILMLASVEREKSLGATSKLSKHTGATQLFIFIVFRGRAEMVVIARKNKSKKRKWEGGMQSRLAQLIDKYGA